MHYHVIQLGCALCTNADHDFNIPAASSGPQQAKVKCFY
jgi:hypothetical protein